MINVSMLNILWNIFVIMLFPALQLYDILSIDVVFQDLFTYT